MEKFLFKKISLWFVLLLFVLGVTSSVIFSSMVRHVVKGGTLLGQWTDVIDDISKFPGKIITLARSNSTKINPQISDTNLSKSLNILDKEKFKNENGYLLVSTYDYENGSFVLLYSLSEDKEIYRWIPPINKIHKLSANFTEGINSRRYYRSQNPVLMKDGSIVFSSGEGPLVKISKCNEIEWLIPELYHHSIQKFDGENLIYAVKSLEKNENNKFIIDDGFAIIDSKTGKKMAEYSMEKILMQNPDKYRGILYGIGEHELDRYHVNEAYPINVSDEFVKKEDVLISIRNLSMVMLYRPSENKIIWSKIGPWLNQHNVKYLGSGKISVFGNNIIRGLPQESEFMLDHSDIYIYDMKNESFERPYKKVMKNSRQRSGGIFQMLENGDGFVELSSDITVKRLSKNNVVWEYIHYLGKSKKGNLNWVRYLNKDEFDLSFIKTKCQ